MKTISTSNLPKSCWIHKNRRYILKGETLSELPHVALEYEHILKANNIPYRKITRFVNSYNNETEEVFEFWNPEISLEEEELTLPLYAEMPDYSYRHCQKNYTKKIPSFECLKAAKKTQTFIEQEIYEYNLNLTKEASYKFAKEKLADGVVTVCLSDVIPYTSFYEIKMNNDYFIVFRIPTLISISGFVVIFNMNKVARNGYLTIQVPEKMVGFTIGKYGANINKWAEILGVKKINIIPIKE